MREMDILLWCDIESDEERIVFIESGRAWETGIIAKAVARDLVDAIKARIALKDAVALAENNCSPNQERIEAWRRLLSPNAIITGRGDAN